MNLKALALGAVVGFLAAAVPACGTAGKCSAATCAGCCDKAGKCVGTPNNVLNTTCGKAGNACTDCAAGGLAYSAQVCVTPCNAATCPTGCCVGNTCFTGDQNNTCGTSGNTCNNCFAAATVCGPARTCDPPCGPANCTGCCDVASNSCLPGFTDSACGSGGNSCGNCSGGGTTCDTTATPRSCFLPGVCPATYPTCDPAVTTTVLATHQNHCSATELANARAACTTPNSASCNAFYSFLAATNANCGTCLTPFKVSFANLDGLIACASSFVSATCNHDTGCVTDCQADSCSGCTPAGLNTCRTNVRAAQCSSFITAANACAGAVISTNGNVCAPATYGNAYRESSTMPLAMKPTASWAGQGSSG